LLMLVVMQTDQTTMTTIMSKIKSSPLGSPTSATTPLLEKQYRFSSFSPSPSIRSVSILSWDCDSSRDIVVRNTLSSNIPPSPSMSEVQAPRLREQDLAGKVAVVTYVFLNICLELSCPKTLYTDRTDVLVCLTIRRCGNTN
jgi:hypothetical protein